MVKYLYHSLAVHALLYKAGHIRQSHLLAHEILSAVSADLPGHKQHQEDDQNRQSRQNRA